MPPAPFTPDSITFTSPPVPINKHELSMLVVLSIVSLAVTATAIVPKSGYLRIVPLFIFIVFYIFIFIVLLYIFLACI